MLLKNIIIMIIFIISGISSNSPLSNFSPLFRTHLTKIPRVLATSPLLCTPQQQGGELLEIPLIMIRTELAKSKCPQYLSFVSRRTFARDPIQIV